MDFYTFATRIAKEEIIIPMHLIIYTDGGARGNPGPAAAGVVIEQYTQQSKKQIAAFGKKIGETTNNVAEYSAVVSALIYVKKNIVPLNLGEEKLLIDFYLDSLLVVNQLNGIFKTKDAYLRVLMTQVRVLEQETGAFIRYTAIPREQNQSADALVNQALDA